MKRSRESYITGAVKILSEKNNVVVTLFPEAKKYWAQLNDVPLIEKESMGDERPIILPDTLSITPEELELLIDLCLIYDDFSEQRKKTTKFIELYSQYLNFMRLERLFGKQSRVSHISSEPSLQTVAHILETSIFFDIKFMQPLCVEFLWYTIKLENLVKASSDDDDDDDDKKNEKEQEEARKPIREQYLRKTLLWENTHEILSFISRWCASMGLVEMFVTAAVPKYVEPVVVGARHTVMFPQDRAGLFVCGDNSFGQLGLGSDVARKTEFVPVPQFSQAKVRMVACGDKHTVVLTDDGAVYGCGSNQSRQLGLPMSGEENGKLFKFVRLDTANVKGRILHIACGKTWTFLLSERGLYVAGTNEYGALGFDKYEHTTPIFRSFALAAVLNEPTIPHMLTICNVVCGEQHTLIHYLNGDVYGLGNNALHQVNPFEADVSFTLPLHMMRSVSRVWAGQFYSLMNDNSENLLYFGARSPTTIRKLFVSRIKLRMGKAPQNTLKANSEVLVSAKYHIVLAKPDGSLYVCGRLKPPGDDDDDENEKDNNEDLIFSHDATFENRADTYGTILSVTSAAYATFVLTSHGLYAKGFNQSGNLGVSEAIIGLETKEFTKVTGLAVIQKIM